MNRVLFELKKRKFFVILAIVLIVGGGFYVNNKKKQEAANKLSSTTVQRGDLQQTLLLSGEIKARQDTKLKFQTAGQLATLNVKTGDVVKKGQLVAALDQRELQKKFRKELNDFKTTRWDFDQDKDDAKDKAITDAMRRVLDQSQFTLDNAVLDVEIQNISLEFAHLSSPIQGIVINTGNFQPGVNVTAADIIAEIVNPDSLYFALTADQTEVTNIHNGMSGKLTLDAYTDEPVSGTIANVNFSPEQDETGTVYGVEFEFGNSSNQNLRYRIGMTGDVVFILQEKKNVLYIPTEYLKNDNQGDYVFVMKNNKKEKYYITKGMETDTSVEIVKGLNQGDLIYD